MVCVDLCVGIIVSTCSTLSVNCVCTATFAIANKKAEKPMETSDLSKTYADVGELLVRDDGKRQTRRPLAFSPVRDQVTARRAKVDIHAKADKSSASSVLNEWDNKITRTVCSARYPN